jgi:predicted P-loop ATPase
MLSQRQRAVIWAGIVLVAIWAVATGGYLIAKNARMTAEKVRAYLESVDLSKLSAAERARALQALADKINKLSREERQQLRIERTAYRWFEQMTEEEKGNFIEATMPTGFKQMISAFEEMPDDERRKAIDAALRRLRETNNRLQTGGIAPRGGTNRAPISPELEAKVRTIGLKTFYSQSSAQTKAELAPVLEELQRTMESGGRFRGR